MPTFNVRRWVARITGLVQRIIRRHPRAEMGAAAAADHDRKIVFGLAHSRIPTARQLRYLPDLLSPAERRTVRWLTTVVVLACLLLTGHWLSRHVGTAPQDGGTLTEGFIGTPQYINPVIAHGNSADAALTTLTFRGLMKVGQDLQAVPDLAESVVASDGGKTYTVKLRPGLRWSDGEPLTAQDIIFTFETLADPEFKSPMLSVFQGVKTEAPDKTTIIFRLPQPTPLFTAALTIGLLPDHAWSDALPQTFVLAELNLKPIGNGPYAFDSLTKDRNGNIKSITFIRNKYYSGPRPHIDKIVAKFYADESSALDALNKQSVDALSNISPAALKKIAKRNKATDFSVSQLTAVFFNEKSNGALKAKEVRTALALATDRQGIVNVVLAKHGRPIVGPILPGYLGYNPDLKRYDFNLDQAKAMLDQAGWKLNDKGIRQKGAQQLTFVFTVMNDPTYLAVANRLMDDWRQIGASIEPKILEPSRMQKDAVRPRQYEALLFGQLFDVDPDPYLYWDSSQAKDPGFNLSIFYNKKIDQDLEDAHAQLDQAKRRTDLLDFQNVIADEVPAVFLYQSVSSYLHDKSIRGLTTQPIINSAHRFDAIDQWYLKTKLTWKANSAKK